MSRCILALVALLVERPGPLHGRCVDLALRAFEAVALALRLGRRVRRRSQRGERGEQETESACRHGAEG